MPLSGRPEPHAPMADRPLGRSILSKSRVDHAARIAFLCVLTLGVLTLGALTGCGGGGGGGGGGTPPVAPVAPSGLDYSIPPALMVGVAITPLSPTLAAGSSNDYTISPALPNGLTLDPATGTIAGTPTDAAPLATYTITASNATGSTTFDLPLEVLAAVVPEIGFTAATQSASEAGGTLTIDLALSTATTIDVSISVSDLSTTATVGVDYTFATLTLMIPAGQTTASFTLDLIDDAIDESDETIELALTSPTGVTIGALGTHTITIVDDEANPVADFSTGAMVLAEDNPTVTIDVQLDRAASTARTVTLATSGSAQAGSDYTIGGATITFSPGDTLGQTTITLIDDAIFEGDEQLNLTLIPGADVQGGTLTTLTITLLAGL